MATKKSKAVSDAGSAEAAYEAYRESLGGQDLQGPMVEFGMLPDHVKAAWGAAAGALIGAPAEEGASS